MKKIAIVPAYNEQGAIGGVVDEIRAFDPEFDVLVVDDCSLDATAETARAHGARVVTLPFNLGIGGAVQTGFRYAAHHGYELAARVDGDGQHDPAELRALDRRRRPRRRRHLRRLALRRGGGLPLLALSARRDPHPRAHRLATDRAALDRHDQRLPGARSQSDRALRCRLSARLSRGRGGADAAQAPAPPHRAAGADARAHRRALLDPRRCAASTTWRR